MAGKSRVIEIPEMITVRDLSQIMKVSPIEIIKQLMKNGIMANINQHIDFDTASIIAEELGFEPVSPVPEVEEEDEVDNALPLHRRLIANENPDNLVSRPPVVTVLGHVDHGKTTLLDTIRKASVADGEAGGITQHIGAYQVPVEDRLITFLDTPGHEAFTAMRARGAQATDLAVLVVAADDGVMPQTREAIEHARAAQVPILVAINKIDKANANPDRVKQELAEVNLVPEEWGGDTVCVPISAKEKIGIDDLLENALLITDISEPRANPNRFAQGTVIEGKIDKRKGVYATLLIQNGTLNQGDTVMIGTEYGKIRAMFSDKGKRIKKAGLSVPVSVLGLSEVPKAGDFFEAVKNERAARAITSERKEKRDRALAAQASGPARTISLEDFFKQREETGDQTLNLIIKADVQGSLEPIVNSLKNLEEQELKIKILSQGTGQITETDVNLALASAAIVVGFQVGVDTAAQNLAEANKIDVRVYDIIYKLIDDVEKALKGLLEPVYEDRTIGKAEVRQLFKIPRRGYIAGSYILEGKVQRNAYVRVHRGNEVLFEGKLNSLKRFTEDVQEVAAGYECGIGIEGFDSLKPQDVLESYIKERVN